MKKRILSTIGIFILAIAFSGCKVGDDELIKTHKGKAMFDAWSEDMQELLQTIILPCFHFNAWLEIDEEHQASLWAFLFHNSTCTVPAPGEPQIWEMRDGANYTFDLSNNPNNLTIYQPGYCCTITTHNNVNHLIDKSFTIRCLGPGEWSVTASNDQLQLLIKTEDADATSLHGTIAVSGSGYFKHTTHTNAGSSSDTYLHFNTDIVSKMHHSECNSPHWCEHITESRHSTLKWENGCMNIEAHKELGGTAYNPTRADIINDHEVSITLNNITQTWRY